MSVYSNSSKMKERNISKHAVIDLKEERLRENRETKTESEELKKMNILVMAVMAVIDPGFKYKTCKEYTDLLTVQT